MRKEARGRQSEASRAVVIRDDSDIVERPKPPAELTAAERVEWIGICNAVPAEYFPPATWHIVASLCRHRVIELHLHELIERESGKRKGFDLQIYRTLLRELRSETTSVLDCLRALRLTHLASYAADHKPLPEVVPKPWLS